MARHRRRRKSTAKKRNIPTNKKLKQQRKGSLPYIQAHMQMLGQLESTRSAEEDIVVARKKKKLKKLTKRQVATLRKHRAHHTKKHMQVMVRAMKEGKTFTQAHRLAQRRVGK